MARDTGVTILLVHHEGKNAEGRQGGRSIRGASAFLGMVDQGLTLERRGGGSGTRRAIKAEGRYIDTPKELLIELRGAEYNVLGTLGEVKSSDDADRVVSAITDEPRTVDQLTTLTGIPKKRLNGALKQLANRLLREGKGVKGSPYTYRLPDSTESDQAEVSAVPKGGLILKAKKHGRLRVAFSNPGSRTAPVGR